MCACHSHASHSVPGWATKLKSLWTAVLKYQLGVVCYRHNSAARDVHLHEKWLMGQAEAFQFKTDSSLKGLGFYKDVFCPESTGCKL